VSGVDAIIGGHSHTTVSGFGDYKFLPTFVSNPSHEPVIVTQAYRYNTNLGQVSLGLLPRRAAATRSCPAPAGTSRSPPPRRPRPAIVALVQPYQT